MQDQLTELQKSLASLLSVAEPGEGYEVVSMTPEQFLAYAGEQLELAKSESDEDGNARLAHLLKSVTTMLEKNAFDGKGSMLPLFKGPLSRPGQTNAGELHADHMEKGGTGISQSAANTEANPTSNWEGRASGAVSKADIAAIAKAAGADESLRADLLASLMGDAKADAAADADSVWPKDLNADSVDTNPELQF